MQYDIRADIKEAEKYLVGLRKDQIPYATQYAINATLFEARKNVIEAMKRYLDKPTPYTLRGVEVIKANKQKLYGKLMLRDFAAKGTPADRYLIYQIEGKPRKHKGFEVKLIRDGYMDSNQYAIPTRFAPLDAYGNVSGSYINMISSQLRLTPKGMVDQRETPASRQRKRRRKQPRFFVARKTRTATRHLAEGVYERMGTGDSSTIKPIFIFTNGAPKYRKRLPFYETINAAIERTLVRNYDLGFKIADATKGKRGDEFKAAVSEVLTAAGVTQ